MCQTEVIIFWAVRTADERKKGRNWNKSSLCTELKICGLQIENCSWIVYYNFFYSVVLCSCVNCCECRVTIQFISACILKTILITSTRAYSSASCSKKNYLVVSHLWLIPHYCQMATVKPATGTSCCPGSVQPSWFGDTTLWKR